MTRLKVDHRNENCKIAIIIILIYILINKCSFEILINNIQSNFFS